jgi:hypothetical protein
MVCVGFIVLTFKTKKKIVNHKTILEIFEISNWNNPNFERKEGSNEFLWGK